MYYKSFKTYENQPIKIWQYRVQTLIKNIQVSLDDPFIKVHKMIV